MTKVASIAAALLLLSTPSLAQIDQEEAVRSLSDVGPFGIVVDVEATLSLASDATLDTESMRARLADRLETLSGRRPSVDPIHEECPYLYVHVNALDAGDGLVPFAVNATFQQPVRVAAGGQQMTAVTWESGFVGLVSYDRLAAIPDAAESLVEEFAEDLVAAGSGS
jgi:hypothetical protein